MTDEVEGKILFVDDEQSILDISREYFQRMGYKVLTAENGLKALEIINDKGVDCCITDINMPNMDGLELAGKIREIDNTIPVVIITGYPSMATAIQTMKNGVVDFLVKPISLKQMHLCLQRVLRERQLFAENMLLKNEVEGKRRLEKLNAELTAKVEELGIMNKIMRDFEGIRSMKEVFQQTVSLALDITPAEEIRFYLVNKLFDEPFEVAAGKKNQAREIYGIQMFDENRGERRCEAVVEADSVHTDTKEELMLKRFITTSLSERIPLIVSNNSGSADLSGESMKRLPPEVKSFMMVPLEIRQKLFGVLTAVIKTEDLYFTQRDLYFLTIMSQKATLALENLALYENIYDNLVSTLSAFVTAVEARDSYTHQHSNRVTEIALCIGQKMELSKEDMDVLNFAGRLHDIGKIGIRDDILLKPGKLTPAEFEKIKEHPIIGANIIGQLGLWEREQQIIRYHHERFDGKGYPEGLRGNEIPLLARILSVADAYDAMASDRAYRKKMETSSILEIIRENSGSQFDPAVTEAFFQVHGEGRLNGIYEPRAENTL
jgi:putative nucleotidyltransferase with HDIG domain